MMDLPAELAELLAAAKRARDHAYAPYSRFLVGAAVRGASGEVHIGCNVENASYGGTICAERAAVCAAVAAGERRIVAVAVFTLAERLTMPCGLCRQVLFELGADATLVAATAQQQRVTSVRALLPEPFEWGP